MPHWFTAILALVTLIPSAVAADPPTRLLVPAYFYPAGDGLKAWETLLDSSGSAAVVAIVNPDSGPGKRVDDNYTALFKKAATSKATLIGYVTLSYGKRLLSAVKADIDSWLFFYPDVRGIFFDEQPSGAELAAFALEGFKYARESIKDATLITNPGVACAREYMGGANGPVACLFEGKDGYDKFAPPAWAGQLPADRFAVLVYNVKTADAMRAALKEATRKRAAYVYVTDADGPMPWGRLPTYWADLVKAVK